MDFEDIRPYHDSEVKEKINSLLKEEQFKQVIERVMPEIPFPLFERQMRKIDTIYDFQLKVVVPLLDKLLSNSTDGLSYNGIENLNKEEKYLFVSTHRDIVLDSALMNYALLKEGFSTAEIAIGDNLMKIPWIVDLVKLNKTFIVKRSLSKEKKIDGSTHLSNYISYTIKEKEENIWIAHKSGRSKDGNDRTNASLIKMFNLGGDSENALENIKRLNICPVSISYEYNPCDALTLPELMTIAKGEKYEKQAMEDLIHMGQGLEGKKGKIEVSFGRPLNGLIDGVELPAMNQGLFAQIAKTIDREIYSTYKLMPSNYLAFDLLNQIDTHSNEYSIEEKEQFEAYVDSKLSGIEGDEAFKKETFLKMYACPVKNKEALYNHEFVK
ncbi:MAG: 1-acyl-sn-glycerol-3-phosphate acyltransferase [Flavobacteriales bacterium]|nr:1-acyl-sn-glycerol-3-phosphate acyltransferase [Flavobacteriales bacterium]